MEAAHQALVDAVEAVTSGEDWLAMLATARRLPEYSPRNCLLLAAQGAQGMVMGYQAWRTIPAVGGGTCQVARAATSLKILAPLTRTRTAPDTGTGIEAADAPATQPAAGAPSGPAAAAIGPANQDGQNGAAGAGAGQEMAGRRIVGFRVVSVFDETSLLSPPDLPGRQTLTPLDLDAEVAEQWWPALARQVEAAGYRVDTSAETGQRIAPSKGRTDFEARIVAVRPDLPPAQQIKTLAHELAHVHLHAPAVRPQGLTRAVAEVEAESAAYLITADLGLDSSLYTIPYVTGWSGGDPETVMATAERAITAARTISQHVQLHLTSPDLTSPELTGPDLVSPDLTSAGQDVDQEVTGPEPGAEPAWPPFLDEVLPLAAGPSRVLGEPLTGVLGEGSPEVLGEGSPASWPGEGPDGAGRVAAVLGSESGWWRLGWEPSRATLSAVHTTALSDSADRSGSTSSSPSSSSSTLADAGSDGLGEVTRTIRVEAQAGPPVSPGRLEEQVGFALPASVWDHLLNLQRLHPPALITPASSAARAGPGDLAVTDPGEPFGGGRDFEALYPSLTAPPDGAASGGFATEEEEMAGSERPLASSPVLVPGRAPSTYVAAMAERAPLRSWAADGFGVQILAARPDPDFPGFQALSYRVTHHDVVIAAGDDLHAPLTADARSDQAVREAAYLAAAPPEGAVLTPAQVRFTGQDAAALQALTALPQPPYPPDTRISVHHQPGPDHMSPGPFGQGPGERLGQAAEEPVMTGTMLTSTVLTGTVLTPISEDGGPVTSYAWRPDQTLLPGHPWADNPGHALIAPAHQVEPTLAGPDPGLDPGLGPGLDTGRETGLDIGSGAGRSSGPALAYGAVVSFPADDATPVPGTVQRAFHTDVGLVYEVQPSTPSTQPLTVLAADVTPVRGTAWPTASALLHAREAAGLPLHVGEVLHVAGRTSYVMPSPNGPLIASADTLPAGFPAATLTHQQADAAPQAASLGPDIGTGTIDDNYGNATGGHREEGVEAGAGPAQHPPGSSSEPEACSAPDCTREAAVTVTISWPNAYREITDRCRPCAAALTVARLDRGCGIDVTPFTHTTPALQSSAVQDKALHAPDSAPISPQAPSFTHPWPPSPSSGPPNPPLNPPASSGPPPAAL